MSASRTTSPPPDQAARDRIATALDTTMLVEAAAGTGKTTSMMNRMVALLAEGRCRTHTMAAVTFTRKATAELRARFQVTLEKQSRVAVGPQRDRLQEALAHVERCFIGTIHSFCARLLRERPIEAGVDAGFRELEEDDDQALRESAWNEHVDRLHATGDSILVELADLGLRVSDLKAAFKQFAGFPDVEEWPAEPVVPDPDLLARARTELLAYVDHVKRLLPNLKPYPDGDDLMKRYRDILRLVRQANLERDRDLIDVLEACCRNAKVVQKHWPEGPEQGKRERDRWAAFVTTLAAPLVEQRHHQRYGPVMRLLRGAAGSYDRLRADTGCLNYQDLLIKAADLLRDRPHIRRYFRRRFTHLLVDEFQDTDPVQAAVMLLLTADDPEQGDWRRCRPVPGSLFVVGDPKQSIYRFRRADIVTYDTVRSIVEEHGKVEALTANFRSVPQVIDWVNGVSPSLFPPVATVYSPADRPMHAAREGEAGGDLTGILRLDIPAEVSKKADIASYEAQAAARLIRDALNRRLTIPRTQRELAAGRTPQVTPGDFMILTLHVEPLDTCARALQAMEIPCEVTGGAAVNDLEDVSLLHSVLAAVVHADDPVALVGALRSAVTGVSDEELYRFSQAGGRFDYRRPALNEGELPEAMAGGLARLRTYARWLDRLPPLAAIERIAVDLGLYGRTWKSGTEAAGGLCKAIELLRAAQHESWTVQELLEHFSGMVDRTAGQRPVHDGLPVRPHSEPAVRIMNLHKAKGLEAPVVFLLGAAGSWGRDPAMHIDRVGDRVRGFLAVHGAPRNYRAPLLACPADWLQRQEEEARFQQAELDRLLYVAATRAGTQLVISRPTGGRAAKVGAWIPLAAAVPDHAVQVVPEELAVPAIREADVPLGAPAAAAGEIASRWQRITEPTYDVQAVKQIAVRGVVAASGGGEHGTEWGTVIHQLLETAIARPGADLHGLARSALLEQGLDTALVDDALAVVDSVTRSAVWRRAMGSRRCLTEVPFQVLRPAGETGGDAPTAVDTVLRGVIDLVFQEDDGWVIVDYKTDDRSRDTIDDLVEHYAPQVRAYAESWAQLVGEPVREAALLFIDRREGGRTTFRPV